MVTTKQITTAHKNVVWIGGAAQLRKNKIPLYKVVRKLSKLNTKNFHITGYLADVIFYERRKVTVEWVGRRIENWCKQSMSI